VARALQGDAKPKAEAAEPVRRAPPRPAAKDAQPAGEGASKRASSLAENLKRWLKGRSRELIMG
jgi:hypothetical protein